MMCVAPPSGLFQGVRALMIVSIVVGVVAVLVTIFALKCLRMGNMEQRVKAIMTLTSGAMFLIAGEKKNSKHSL